MFDKYEPKLINHLMKEKNKKARKNFMLGQLLEFGEPELDVATCDIKKPALVLSRNNKVVEYTQDALRKLAANDSSIYEDQVQHKCKKKHNLTLMQS